MAIIFSSGYSLAEGGYLLAEDGSFLLLESGGKILLDYPFPLTHARIMHSNLWLSGGTATASTTATNYLADGPMNSLTYERWKPTTNTATWQYTHTVSGECGCAGIAAHTLGTTGSSIKFQYYSGGWTDLTDWTQITSNEPIMAFWDDVMATQFRVVVAFSTAPELGVVKFGTSLAMERPLYAGHSPLDLARVATLRGNESETGEFLGRSVLRTHNSASFSWQHLTAGWIRLHWPSLQRGIEKEPFFIAWRPSSFDTAGYMKADSSPIPVNMGIRDLMSVELVGKGLGYD